MWVTAVKLISKALVGSAVSWAKPGQVMGIIKRSHETVMVLFTASCSQAYVTELQTLYTVPLVRSRLPGVFPDNCGTVLMALGVSEKLSSLHGRSDLVQSKPSSAEGASKDA